MAKKPRFSFTTVANGLVNVLKNTCQVSKAKGPEVGGNSPPMSSFEAIWDTGATRSMITQAVIDACGLKPSGKTTISHAEGDTPNVDTFSVDILLPNDVLVQGVRVAKAVLKHGDVLIGMDILTLGDFAVTNAGGRTKFSFQIPSQEDIDFAAKTQQANLVNKSLPTPEKRAQANQRANKKKKKHKNRG